MSRVRLFFVCAVAVFASAVASSRPVLGQNASLEERLQRLEAEVGTLRKENQQLRSELGLEGRAGQTLVKPAGREPTISVGGLLQAQADFGDKGDARFATGNDRFSLRRARINLQGRFLEEFDFKIEGEFAGTIAEASGNRAQLTDAFINWNRFDFANVRAGQFKTPFGYEQLYVAPRLFAIERSLSNDRLTVSRQIGLQVGGDLFEKRGSYAVGLFNGTSVNTTANDNDKFMWAGRVSATGWQGTLGGQDARWSFGADGFTTSDTTLSGQPAEFGHSTVATGPRNNTFAGRREAGGLDSQLRVGGFELWTEYLRQNFKPTSRIPVASFDADGWYVQGTCFVLPKTLQALAKYDEFDPNVDVANNRTQTWTLGANYYFKADDLKLQLDYLITDVDGQPAKNKKLLMRLQTIF